MAEGIGSRIRRWLRSLIGRESESIADTAADSAEPEADASPTTAAVAYECAICGSPVESAEGPCPLCHSTEIVPAGKGAEPPAEAGPGPRPAERRVADPDDPAASLASLRDSGKDVLVRHAEKWEDRGDGGARRYRVSLPDDGERFVGSREDVRSLLFRHYGPEDGEREGEGEGDGDGDGDGDGEDEADG